MKLSPRRAVAVTAFTAIGVLSAAFPASADTAPNLSCDTAVIANAIKVATSDVTTARKAYTTHTKTSWQTLAKGVRAAETVQAQKAAKKAAALDKAARKAKGKDRAKANAAAAAARKVAIAEARDVAKLNTAEISKRIRAERAELKADWEATQATLRALKAHKLACEAPVEPVAPPVDPVDPVAPVAP